jgi:hypothetical protein
MRLCPSCGYENDETAAVCIQCNRTLSRDPGSVTPLKPPDLPGEFTSSPEQEASSSAEAPRAPYQTAPPLMIRPAQGDQHRKQYFLGLGFGFIPLAVFLIVVGFAQRLTNATGSSTAVLIALLVCLLLYLAEIIATIVFLTIARWRYVGYGLLTAVLVTPVAGSIGCVVIITSGL